MPAITTACRAAACWRQCRAVHHKLRQPSDPLGQSEPVGNAGQPYRHSSTSILAPTGLSSDGPGYVTRDTCRSGDLAQVELRRNFGQTLVTLLTLGIVSPATFYYLCEKPAVPPPPPPCNCTEGPEL